MSLIAIVANLAMRLLDVVTSFLGLILLSPVFLVVALLIKLDSPGPIFYRAQRAGRAGQPFRLYKFRSMAANAEKRGPGITAAGDRRITFIGRILRRTKIDELPQLINVFKGDMSLVGPRPEDPRYVALYTPEQRKVLNVRPGITSAASVRYRHEEVILTDTNWEHIYLTVVMPDKLRIDLDYIEHRTFASDLLILWQTFLALFH